MFEQERVNEITTKLNQALLAGDFEAAQELMSPGLKKTVTKEQWKQWQAVIAAKRDLRWKTGNGPVSCSRRAGL